MTDGLVRFSLHSKCSPEVIAGRRIIGFQADGFLQPGDRFVNLPFAPECIAEVVGRDIIIGRNRERAPEQGFAVLPISQLLPRHHHA